MDTNYDVAIIGGGPGGTTTGCLLRKYAPNLRVGIFEKDRFPREHIGESQLPPIQLILHEMGCWEKVEAAKFPIKIGATYTWGKTTEPWVFELVPEAIIPAEYPRPGKYEGWRTTAAYQVDRAVYDDILLRHAQAMGCDVLEGVGAKSIRRSGDRVDGVELQDGRTITARHYIDASGNAAILRKAMGVKVDAPTLLRNVAFWEYWDDPAFAQLPDVNVCRIHIRSLPYGWIWHIRIAPTRFSTGLVCPAEYYKKSGLRPDEIYHKAMREEPSIAANLKTATCTGEVRATTDWSFVVDRTFGENWYLVGECAGFADPILSAGLTLTQAGGRELAYTILELDRGEHSRDWLLTRFDELQRRRVRQHIRFADFWYSANGLFDAVRENCSAIAADAGIKLNAADAFRWLSFGGLGDDVPGQVGIGGLDIAGTKGVMARMTGTKAVWNISGKNVFKLNLANATEATVGVPQDGRITPVRCWTRGDRSLAEIGVQGMVIRSLQRASAWEDLVRLWQAELSRGMPADQLHLGVNQAVSVLEVMAGDFWVLCETDKRRPIPQIVTGGEDRHIYTAAKREIKRARVI